MNAVAARRDNRCRGILAVGGRHGLPGSSEPPQDDGDVRIACWCFRVGGLGVASLGGYFLSWAGHADSGRFSHHLWRFHAQAPSGDVQPSAGFAFDRERSERCPAQLSVMFGTDRAVASWFSAAAAVTRHIALHLMWTRRSIHSRRGLIAPTNSRLHAAVPMRILAPGSHRRGRSHCGVQAVVLLTPQIGTDSLADRRGHLARCAYYPSAPAGGRGIVA